MDVVYLRGRDGSKVGPLDPQWIEVLYDARLVDGETPLSPTGRVWQPLKEWPALVERIRTMRSQFSKGINPWHELSPRPVAPASARADLLESAPTLLAKMLTLAVNRSEGLLEVRTAEGPVRLDYRDGKILGIEPSDPGRFFRDLVERGVVQQSELTQAELAAPSFGGDLGTALVASGLIAPDVFVQELTQSALRTIGDLIAASDLESDFDPNQARPVAMPLSLDRLGVYLEGVRALPRKVLSQRLLPNRRKPLIVSQFEGLERDQLKLHPKELRALQLVNGVRTLSDVLDHVGSEDDRTLAVLVALFFCVEAGLVVLGEDPEQQADWAQAEALEKRLAQWEQGTYFDILGLGTKTTDAEVRDRYTGLAKELHPDNLRPEADPRLVEAHQRAFRTVTEAFEALETEDRRTQYALDLQEGRVGTSQDLETAQNALQAETLFKKAEILVRVKKYDEAQTHMAQALSLMPEEKDYMIFGIYVDFLAATGGRDRARAEEAAQRILSVMKFDATVWSGYLYLAYLYKIAQKPDLAGRYFEKVLEYEENHPEAVQEVRLARMRKEREKKKKKWL